MKRSKKAARQVVMGAAIPNLPWEERPKGCREVLWRFSKNPIIPRDLIPSSNSIFNSAAVAFRGGFAGVFRCDDRGRRMDLHAGRSRDGIRWEIEDEVIRFTSDVPAEQQGGEKYDPRVVWLEDRYYVTWCNCAQGPTVGMGYTHDFKKFYQMENAFPPYNRNGVLFPRRIRGRYYLLHRPSGPGHNPYGNMYLSESPDLVHWGRHRCIMKTRSGWDSTKIGAGPAPVETAEGWLLIYHGVLTSCNGFVYSAGLALLDLDEPWRVLARPRPYVLSPQTLYECVGDVPNVVFPCAVLCDAPTGRMAIYYGCADTVTGLAFAHAEELLEFVRSNP